MRQGNSTYPVHIRFSTDVGIATLQMQAATSPSNASCDRWSDKPVNYFPCYEALVHGRKSVNIHHTTVAIPVAEELRNNAIKGIKKHDYHNRNRVVDIKADSIVLRHSAVFCMTKYPI